LVYLLRPGRGRKLARLYLISSEIHRNHPGAAMAAQRNETDDALGIAHIMRTGWFESAYVKQESHQ
jgi:hypothetical protein